MKPFHSYDYWKNYKSQIERKDNQVDSYSLVAERLRTETEKLRQTIPLLRESLEPIRASAQEAENKLSITIGTDLVPLPPEIEAKLREGLAAANQRPNIFVRGIRKIRHAAYAVAATLGRIYDTTSDVWPQRWQQIAARIAPPVATVTTGLLTAVGALAATPVVIAAIAASTALTAHHIGNNTDRDNLKVYRKELNPDFAPPLTFIRCGITELSRTFFRTVLRPIHTIRAYKHAGLNPFDLEEATSVHHALDRRERANKRDFRLLTDEHEDLSARCNTIRLSVEAFRAWKRLAQWEREDEVDRRIDRTRDLRSQLAANRILNQPVADPVASIDLKELETISKEDSPAPQAIQTVAEIPTTADPAPVDTPVSAKQWARSGPPVAGPQPSNGATGIDRGIDF